MALKVLEAIGSDEKTASKLDLFSGLDVSESLKNKIQQDVGEFLVEQVIQSVTSAKTPVSGESWKKSLSPGYKKKKIEEGGDPVANMEEHGDMLDALTFKPTDEGIEIGFFDEQAAKADGHLKFSGRENNTPKRRFLPDEGQNFKTDIRSEVEKIVSDAIADETSFKPADFNGVETQSDLIAVLRDQFSGLSKAEIVSAVLRNQDLVALLEELDLLDLIDG